MKNKFISAKEAAALVKDGDFIMVGGFLGHGTPILSSRNWLTATSRI